VASSETNETFRWHDASWHESAESWIRETLRELGCPANGTIEQPHVRPWATAFRVPTTRGVVWFKACIPTLAHEVPLLVLLHARRPDCVPRVIAADAARGWMLLEDAGAQVHELEGVPRVERWAEFVATYAQLQIDVIPLADELVRAGVPDSRWPRMFDELAMLLGNERNLRSSPNDAVTRDEVVRLRSLLPRFRDHARRLDALGLPASIQHDDLHAWNVFVRDGSYVFLDWGDSCVSHPLLSLGVPLEHTRASMHERIRDAYLEPWSAFAPRGELVAMCDSAILLAKITAILKWARIFSGLGDSERSAYDEVISLRVRDLLESACA
jgi:hypothetical protein